MTCDTFNDDYSGKIIPLIFLFIVLLWPKDMDCLCFFSSFCSLHWFTYDACKNIFCLPTVIWNLGILEQVERFYTLQISRHMTEHVDFGKGRLLSHIGSFLGIYVQLQGFIFWAGPPKIFQASIDYGCFEVGWRCISHTTERCWVSFWCFILSLERFWGWVVGWRLWQHQSFS